jgi:aryl-alcohol dehydrogenase-like predicted oxidoreductase
MGTMQFGWTADEATSLKVLSEAHDAGINFLDTADIYSRWVDGNPGGVAEEIIGKWIKSASIQRENLIIATKVRGQMSRDPADQGLSRDHIFKSVDHSLHRLQTDYIDLYQSHWYDDNVPIEETLQAYDDLIQQGKVRYIGCSNYPAWRFMQSLWAADRAGLARYDTLQPHYNLVHRAEFERELAEVCREYEIAVIPYSPLAGGFLTGKYQKNKPVPEDARGRASQRIHGYFTENNWQLLEKMEAMGTEKGGYSISQITLAWQLSNPLLTAPIIGPKNLAQLEDNLGAVNLRLTEPEMETLNQASNWQN